MDLFWSQSTLDLHQFLISCSSSVSGFPSRSSLLEEHLIRRYYWINCSVKIIAVSIAELLGYSNAKWTIAFNFRGVGFFSFVQIIKNRLFWSPTRLQDPPQNRTNLLQFICVCPICLELQESKQQQFVNNEKLVSSLIYADFVNLILLLVQNLTKFCIMVHKCRKSCQMFLWMKDIKPLSVLVKGS